MMIALASLVGVYGILILSLYFGFNRVSIFESETNKEQIKFSVVIPFRNEERNLEQLLGSLTNLQYDSKYFECLFVNDDSTDSSVEIINRWKESSPLKIQLINNQRRSKSPKKDAITSAINIAKYDWIITTDADCILPDEWLIGFSDIIHEKSSKMVVGPVRFKRRGESFVHHFQELDFLSLQGATIGGFGLDHPFLCNGANLAYQKDTFLKVNGFEGNSNIASGDDIFLFEKFYQKYPHQVHFLKSRRAIVSTHTLDSWKEVIEQRTRWAAKSTNYQLVFSKLVGLIVLFGNLALIGSLFYLNLNLKNILFTIVLWDLKMALDLVLIYKTHMFLNENSLSFGQTIKASLIYPFFSTYITLRAGFRNYEWKGRRFKQ